MGMYQTQIEFVKDLKETLNGIDGKTHAQLNKMDALATSATASDIVTAFNLLIADLKSKGYMATK